MREQICKHCMFCVLLQTQETNALITAVLEVQPRLASGGSGKTSDEIVFELAESILSKLPLLLDMEKADKTMFEAGIFSLLMQHISFFYLWCCCFTANYATEFQFSFCDCDFRLMQKVV